MATQNGSHADFAPTAQDTVKIAGYFTRHTLINANGVITVTNKDTGEVHTFVGVNTIKFADKHVTFDITGKAGQVYRLYQAAFNRAPDADGLGFWINAAENGVPIESIAAQFLDSAEFKRINGDNITAEKFISVLYNNVLHRAPDVDGYNWWVNAIKAGNSRQGALNGFSESNENKSNVNPNLANGFSYIPFARQAGDPIPVKATSYANAKEQDLAPFTLPDEVQWSDAYGRADFKQNGTMTLFATKITYDTRLPESQATKSVFAFYSKDANGNWVKEPSMIDTQVGCVHPRKALIADFNNDGKPDVFVACTGYDAGSFPGENNYIVLSTDSNVYVSRPIPATAGYFHSASAADFNGDGKIDVVVTDTKAHNKTRMFMGNGDGSFTEDSTKLPNAFSQDQFYTVEATDVDGDGTIDLLFGGDESMGQTATLVVVGNGTGNFTTSRIITLPGDPQNQSVLDFVVKNGVIYVNRTASAGPAFYNTKAIQRIDFSTRASSTVFSVVGQGWVHWLIPTATGVSSDNTATPASANY